MQPGVGVQPLLGDLAGQRVAGIGAQRDQPVVVTLVQGVAQSDAGGKGPQRKQGNERDDEQAIKVSRIGRVRIGRWRSAMASLRQGRNG
jgi:hypothetical protein